MTAPLVLLARIAVLIVTLASDVLAAAPPVDRVAFAPAAGSALPLDARFIDEDGHAVRLGDYFGEHPAIVVLGYYACSNLCSTLLNGLAASVATTGFAAGRDFDVVVATIDPRETPADARARKRAVVVGADARGWHFITGDERAIARLAAALDYRYDYDAAGAQYAHAAGVTIARADGRVQQVLYGVAFPAPALTAALRAAALPSQARSSPSPNGWLLCFRYDPHTGRYTFAALAAVRLTALAALSALALLMVRAWRRERREGAR